MDGKEQLIFMLRFMLCLIGGAFMLIIALTTTADISPFTIFGVTGALGFCLDAVYGDDAFTREVEKQQEDDPKLELVYSDLRRKGEPDS